MTPTLSLAQGGGTDRRTLNVFVLEVDMSAAGKTGCSSCNATLGRVREAVDLIPPVFDSVGVELDIAELRVGDLTQARALGLRASPMVRIGGIDLYPEHQVRTPDSSGWLDTDRVWRWNGRAFDQPPRGMLIDALLRAYAQGAQTTPSGPAELVPYLRQFLEDAPPAETASECGCG